MEIVPKKTIVKNLFIPTKLLQNYAIVVIRKNHIEFSSSFSADVINGEAC